MGVVGAGLDSGEEAPEDVMMVVGELCEWRLGGLKIKRVGEMGVEEAAKHVDAVDVEEVDRIRCAEEGQGNVER